MIKAEIISGFLGAGKTTLISKLLKEKLNKEKVVLIENEFGEIGIDSGFLKDSGVIVNEMNSGCICCSLVGDFETSLQEVIDTYNPDRIIIEPSGVGKLSDVIKAVNTIEEIKINSYSTVVDASKAKIYSKNFKEFFNDQIRAASCIILSKTQNISEEKLKETIDIIKNINNKARIVTTSWEDLSADDLLNVMEGSVKLFDEASVCSCGIESCNHNHHEHSHQDHHEHSHQDHHNHHHADDIFTSIGYETINKYSKEELYTILSNLDDDILRSKGIVQDKNNNWLFFDFVPNEIDIREGTSAYTGLITIIGTKNFNQDKIKKAFGI
ncbi:MAG: GTP-binding protein [Erysipelotrichaceae bacterium]|nr:GTP-binding protein [Erysipelotrichaceae bacterium]